MEIFINFTDSLTVSRGNYNDVMAIKINDPKWF